MTFAITMPLDFDPGTASAPNVGYIILGEVVATVAGRTISSFDAEQILRPMGITRGDAPGGRQIFDRQRAVRHLTGSLIPLPAMLLPMVNSTGGWSARGGHGALLTSLDGSRGPSVLNEKDARPDDRDASTRSRFLRTASSWAWAGTASISG